jgi:hypothetical protein
MSPNDQELTSRIRKELDDSCESLDAETLSKLNRARHRALKATPRRSLWLVPLAGVATAASIGLLSINLFTTQVSHGPQADFVEDIELLSSSEDLDFYQNLEFYLWLEDEQPLG